MTDYIVASIDKDGDCWDGTQRTLLQSVEREDRSS